MNFTFKTEYIFFFVPAAILISLFISYLYYRKSRLEGIQKKIFFLLRATSVFLILLLLSSPVISFVKKFTEEPVNVFLIDNSQSLLINNRAEKLNEFLTGKYNELNPSGAENLFFLFSDNLYKEIDRSELEKITYDGINNFETNLTGSLYSLRDALSNKNLSSLTIISDGIINKGGSPAIIAKSLNIPVNYFLIGDTIQQKDLVIKNIYYNKSAFIESSVPISIEMNSYEFDRAVEVNLLEEGKLIETKTVNVNHGQSTFNVLFNVMSAVEAVKKYKVEIKAEEGEITLKNNYREFFIKFTSNKLKILVLAGGPSADVAFLTEEIKRVKNFEPVFMTQKSSTEFYEGALPELSEFDSFILIGFPTQTTNPNILNEIKGIIDKNNSSLIFFASRNTDYKKLAALEEKLPFRFSGYSENEQQTGVRAVSIPDNEVFKNPVILPEINSLPDIFKTATEFSANSSSETFLLTSVNSQPALLIQNADTKKSAAFLVYGFYKWRLNNKQTNGSGVLNYLISNTLLAITNKEDTKKFMIETERPVYSKYENVKFVARIKNLELQGGENIRVKIRGNNYNNEISLLKKDTRYYEGEININKEGDYEFTGELYAGNALTESIQNRFSIGENNFEYRLTRSDNTILSEAANESGGINFTNKNDSEVKNFLLSANSRSKSESSAFRNLELNVNPYYLAALILLLCLEWFLRKRNNLP